MELEISKEETDYMYKLVEKIIEEVGPRMPCSPQEAEGAKIIKTELEQTCDDVVVESFTCHPKAFLGWIKMIIIMSFFSMLFYLFMQWVSDILLIAFSLISFLLIFLSFLIMWEEFFNYNEFIDAIFRKRKSQNVIGKFRGKEEQKKIIIFSSHIDSALQFNLLKMLGWGFIPLAFIGILLMLTWLILSFINLIVIIMGFISLKGIFLWTTYWLLIIGTPCFLGLFFFVPLGDKGNVVPGAVDNLSSCVVIVGLGRYINKHKEIIPKNTEIRLISFGCEESGLRGSRRYISAHLEELKKNDTIVVNMDGLETPDMFHVIEYEPTTRTRHSEEVIQKLLKAAELVGIKANRLGAGKLEKTLGRLSGGSDAAVFSKANIKAAFLNSADWKRRSSYYHQDTDTPDKIRGGTLENALKICITFLLNEKKYPE
ncbi:MAG: M28 family metallopeptidase [Candidatus Hodarchaeota archaeon]